MLKGQGEMERTKEGANRESNKGRGRFDLLPNEAIEAWAKWAELGADKYGDRNWEDGLSVKDCINRMIRHAHKAADGWTDEDHLAAVMWNTAAAITMMARKPECNDHKWNYTIGIDYAEKGEDLSVIQEFDLTNELKKKMQEEIDAEFLEKR